MYRQITRRKSVRRILSCALMICSPVLLADISGPTTYNYCSDKHLDMYLPDSQVYSGPRPAILMFVGSGVDRIHYHASLRNWANAGYVASIASYTQGTTRTEFTQGLIDGRCAVRWLKANSENLEYYDADGVPVDTGLGLPVDVNKIVAAGHSLGSFVTQTLAFVPGDNEDDGVDTPWEQATAALAVDPTGSDYTGAGDYLGSYRYLGGPLETLNSDVQAAAVFGSSSGLLALATNCGVVHSDFLTADKKNAALPMPEGCGPYQNPQRLWSTLNGGGVFELETSALFDTSWQILANNLTGVPMHVGAPGADREEIVPGQAWLLNSTRALWEAASPITYLNDNNPGVPFFVIGGVHDPLSRWEQVSLLFSAVNSKGNLTKGYRYEKQSHNFHTNNQDQQRINNRNDRDALLIDFLNTVLSDQYQQSLVSDPDLAYAHAFTALTPCVGDICGSLPGYPGSEAYDLAWTRWYECDSRPDIEGEDLDVVRICLTDILPYDRLEVRNTAHDNPNQVYAGHENRFSALAFDAQGGPLTEGLLWKLDGSEVGNPGDNDFSGTFQVGGVHTIMVEHAAAGKMVEYTFVADEHPLARPGNVTVTKSWFYDRVSWPDGLGLVDVYRNGNKVLSGIQSHVWGFWDPAHDDFYKVCMTGTNLCSAVVRIQ